MFFYSLPFFIFFTFFFFLYWIFFNKNLKSQNLLVLIGSYFFYCWADWRLLFFLIATSTLIFFLGIAIEKSSNSNFRKLFLCIGLIQGIAGLLFFKYFNFFITSFNRASQSLNFNGNLQTLNIIVPIGISFFTFKTINYILDIEKGKIQATKDWVVFYSYIAFFPTILSGPIDRANFFIPQLQHKRTFDYNQATDGLRQILWGLFKKIVIADNLASVTTYLFLNYLNLPASSLLLGSFFYTIQIYADFSGYSDMAIGFARLLGFRVTQNFNFPFFAQNISDYWRRWHMSLTSLLTEYIHTPLTIFLRDFGKAGISIAIIATFLCVGIWHGANWTYVLFGFLHGCYFIPLILKGKMNKKKSEKNSPSTGRKFLNRIGTFTLVMLTFVTFRVDHISDAFRYFKLLLSKSIFTFPEFENKNMAHESLIYTAFIVFFMVLEWNGREGKYAIESLGQNHPKIMRQLFYVFLIFLIGMYAPTTESPFIYLKF